MLLKAAEAVGGHLRAAQVVKPEQAAGVQHLQTNNSSNTAGNA